jgi:glutathione S-transferase
MNDSRPTLWHIDISHYSEKARWALDYKEVPHVRRAVTIPGAHIPAAMWLTRSTGNFTFPVLQLEGRTIGDSTEIIAALEERFPDPALYPTDPEQRRRALELEAFEAVIKRSGPASLARMSSGAVSYARTFTGLRFGVRSDEAAERARGKVLAALDRLEAELGSGEYLVGDSFSVADLTAAALFYPLVVPEGGPLPTDEPGPKGLEHFRAPLKERRGFKWVEEMFRRHRRPVPAAVTA